MWLFLKLSVEQHDGAGRYVVCVLLIERMWLSPHQMMFDHSVQPCCMRMLKWSVHAGIFERHLAAMQQ